MRKLFLGFSVVTIFSLLPGFTFNTQSSDTEKTAADRISERSMRAHVSILSDDLFEGRGTAQRGMVLASRYIASQFENVGVQPAGDNGTYYQNVKLNKSKVAKNSSIKITLGGNSSSSLQGERIIYLSQNNHEISSSSEVFFAGYGINTQNENWNDYKGADVNGKIVMILPGLPDDNIFKANSARRYASLNTKINTALQKGASGILILLEKEKPESNWNRRVAGGTRERTVLPPDENENKQFSAFIDESIIAEMYKEENNNISTLKEKANIRGFQAAGTGIIAEIDLRLDIENVSCRNVIGIVKGQIEDEYVIVSSHVDHLGMNPNIDGDNIFNGAVDNATGSAGLIEIGRVFADLPDKPKRSIILIGYTGEELYFLGSKFYAQNPIYDLGKTLANINIDECLNHGKMTQVCIIGGEKSTLGKTGTEIAEDMGMEAIYDIPYLQGAFFLSDQISLANVGVPGILIYTGFKHEGRPDGWSKEMFDDYYAKRIHRPPDEYSPDWNMDGIMQIIRLGFRMAYRVSNSDIWPVWHEGQPFKEIRDKSLK